MRYENEAGLTELGLRHLGLCLLSKRRIHIKAGQMFKVTWLLRGFRILSGT